MQEMMAGDPQFEQMLVELEQLLQQAQPQQQAPMTNDQMAANIERQRGRFPANMQVQPPFGTDVLGRKETQARARDPGTTELITNALGDPKWTNAIYNAAPIIDAGPQIAKDTYANTITEPVNALVDATKDPSIANITNAGVRTALGLAPVSPKTALTMAGTIGGLGLTTGAGVDAFNAITKQPVEAADNDPIAKMDARLREINNAFVTKKSLANPKLDLPPAERRTLEDEARSINATKAAIALKSATTGIESEAATKRDSELRQDQARKITNNYIQEYEDSRKPGQIMQTINKLGTFAPAVASMIPGGISRIAGRGHNPVRDYVSGFPLALAASNAQQLDAYFNEPAVNPERTAYQKGSRVLADTDPLKAKYDEKIKELPALNPIPQKALENALDPVNLAKRGIVSAMETTAAPLGYDLTHGVIRAPSAIARKVGEIPGALKEGYNRGMQRANAVNQTAQPQLSPQHQELVADAWLTRNNPNNVIPGQQGFRTQAEMRAYALQQLGVNQQQPQAPTPGPSITNRLATIAKNAALPAAGVGAGYGLTKLFGQ